MTLKISQLAFLEIEDAKEYYIDFLIAYFMPITDSTILVLSVAHQHKKPFYLS